MAVIEALIDTKPDPPGFRRRRGSNQYNPRVTEPAGYLSCCKCKQVLPFASFYNDKSTKYGYSYSCIPCAKETGIINHHKRIKTDPKYKEKKYASHVKSKFNLTLADVEAMFVKQKGLCACCGKAFTGKPHIDHNHTTGKVRSLLCPPCNTGLGAYEKNRLNFERYLNGCDRVTD